MLPALGVINRSMSDLSSAPPRNANSVEPREPVSSRIAPCLLYLTTGILSGGEIYSTVIWGIWGRPTHPTELIALIGSLVLIVAAFRSLWSPKRAAWFALFATLTQWVYFGPSVNWLFRELFVDEIQWAPSFSIYLLSSGLVLVSALYSLYVLLQERVLSRIGPLNLGAKRWPVLATIAYLTLLVTLPFYPRLFPQEIEVLIVQWMPGPEPLSVGEPASSVTKKEIKQNEVAQLQSLGLTGQLSVRLGEVYGSRERRDERHARVVIVMQPWGDSVVELLQPNGSNVLYVQKDNQWLMYPPDVPTLHRLVRIIPRREREPTGMIVQLAMSGGIGHPVHWKLPCTGGWAC